MGGRERTSASRVWSARIIVPILIAAAVGGIWLFKASGRTSPVVDDNPDFALHVTEELDLEQLMSYGIPIVIDFGADSCDPCRAMAPVLKELNEELRGKAIIKFVDVWKYQGLADGFPVYVIPTQVFFDGEGKPYVPSDPAGMMMQMYALQDTNEHVFTTHEGGMTKEQIMAALLEMGMEE